MLSDFERADRIGQFWGYPETRTFAELLATDRARSMKHTTIDRRESRLTFVHLEQDWSYPEALIRSPSQSNRWSGWQGTTSSCGSSRIACASAAEPPT